MRWTNEEIEYLKDNYLKRIHVDDICSFLKRSRRAVQHKAARLGFCRKGMLVRRFGEVTPRKIIDRKYYLKNSAKIHQGKLNRRWRIKRKIVDLLGGGCSLCGYNKCLSALEFHHNGNKKDSHVSELIKNTSEQNVLKETKRCILVCANCHRELHSKGMW